MHIPSYELMNIRSGTCILQQNIELGGGHAITDGADYMYDCICRYLPM